MDSQQSATFPDVPVKLLANERAQSDVMEKHEFDRKQSFRPPYDPN